MGKKAEVSEEGVPGKQRKPSFTASSYGGSTGEEHTCPIAQEKCAFAEGFISHL